MKYKGKKIALLFAGGTTITEKGIVGSTVNNERDIDNWLAQILEISLMAEIIPIFISSKSDGVELWKKIGQVVNNNIDKVDGFVLTLDVDSIITIGSALSFSLQNLNKPVIITGSQITKETIKLNNWQEIKKKSYGGLGIKANLINAVQLATMEAPAVLVMFGNRIIRAVKTTRVYSIGLNIFESIDQKYSGRIDFGISLSEKFVTSNKKIELINEFKKNIDIINYFSGLEINTSSKKEGVILKNLSNLELVPKKIKQPFIVYNRYLVLENNILVNNMTWETTVVKFMWALGQTNDKKKINELMKKEICKEFI